MREIPLTKGKFALVDDDDFERLSVFKWYLTPFGYAVRHVPNTGGRRHIRMHREVLGIDDPRVLVDHINMDRLDNRKVNLRGCTQSQNLCNRPSTRNTSGFKGVTYFARTGRWCAKICHKLRTKNLGYYDTPEEAHEVYCLWADMLHGEFAHYGVKS